MDETDQQTRGTTSRRRSRADRLFEKQDVSKGLAKKTVVGGLYTASSSAIMFIANSIGVILITRNLSDQDFGLYGMVVILTGFATLFVDVGLGQAVIQKPKITHKMVSTLFWINLIIATLIAATVAAATPLLVWFYDEPRLAPINLVMSATFILSGLRLQHQALLRRGMAFRALSIIDMVSLIIATAIVVTMAYNGFGVWALVALPITSQVISLVGLWSVSGWVPSRPERGHGVKEMLMFGGNLTGVQTISYFAGNSDNIMLGFAWGAGPLGLYTRAYSLMMLPVTKFNRPLSGVVTPILSRVTDDPERYRRIYLQMVRVCAAILTPLVCLLLLTVHATVPLLLGEKWLPIIPIFYALGPLCILKATASSTNWLYITLGHVNRLFRWTVYTVPLIVIAVSIGLQFGPLGVAIAMSCVSLVRRPLGIAYAVRGTPVKYREVLLAITIPILGCAGAAIAPLLWLKYFGNSTGLWMQLFVLSALFVGIYLLLLMTTPLGKPHRTSLLRLKTSLKSP